MKLFGVVYTMSVWLPLPRAQNACFRESAVTDSDVAFHCTEIKKNNYYCKGFQHHLLLTHPEAMYFFFPLPAMFHAESLVHKGPPHIVDPFPSVVFLSALLLGPKCIQQGFIRVGPGCVLVCGELGTFIFYFIFCCNVI